MRNLLILFLLTFFTTNTFGQSNKILNPGFEDIQNTPIKVTYSYANGRECNKWILSCHETATPPSRGNLSVISTDANSGDKSMEVVLEEIAARFRFFLFHDMKGLKPGKYTLSFYSKANIADMPFRVDAIACSGADYKTEKQLLGAKDGVNGVYPENQAGHMLKTSTEWQKHTIDIFASGLTEDDLGVLRLVIRPNCEQTGSSKVRNTPVTYLFDDFELINENEKPVESGYPTFAAISDIHVNRGGNWANKINKTFTALSNQNPKLDAIFITGDLTHNGTQEEFDMVKQLVAEKLPADIPVYYCMGNHDWWASATEGGNMFVNTLEQPLNQYIKIKGYPFVMISMETKNEHNAYGEKTRTFLKNSLMTAASEFPNKPIFVFMHVPNTNTVYGSFEIGGGDAWGTSTVQDILEKYPQAVAISGHSHYFLADERSIHQDKFTSINDGSASYAETEKGLEGGTRPKDGEKVLEGCFISLDENNDVIVKRWDFYNDKEIKTPWIITAPHDGSSFKYAKRDGKPNPYFDTDDKLTIVKDDNALSCIAEFPIAKDDDVVTYYRIELLDSDKNVVSTYKILSEYYLPTMSSTHKWTITGLVSGKTYSVQVVAIDVFSNESTPLASETFIAGNGTDIAENESTNIQLQVYPNPIKAGELLSLDMKNASEGKWTVDLYTTSGLLLQSYQFNTSDNVTLNMPTISGTYILKTNTAGLSKETKILVK